MPELERVTVRLEADISDYKRSLRQAEQAAARTAERITATFRDVHRDASRVARGPQAFGVTLRRVSTLSGDKRNLSSLRSATAGSRGISQAADTLAERPGGDAARRLANMPKQAASASSFLKTGFKTLFRIVGVISDIVAFMALGSEILSKKSGGLDVQLEKQNKLVREQSRKLLDVKGLIYPVAEEVENTETLLSQELERLKTLQSRRKGARNRLEGVKRGGGDQTLDPETNLKNALDTLNRIEAGISQRELNISLLEKALAAQAVARDSAGAGLGPELERCLQLLCDRLDSFGQDIPFDRASAQPGDARLIPASIGGGAGSDAAAGSLFRLGGNAGDATREFTELNEQVARFKAQGGPLAKGLAESNALFGSQADRLRTLGGLLPDIGRQLIDVFDGGAEGAEDLNRAVAAMGKRFLDAFEGAIVRGESLGDVLKSLGRDLANLALNKVKTGGLDGLFDILGGFFTSTPSGPGPGAGPPIRNAKGNAFTNGRLASFARGGAFTNSIVNRPTLFPMADGAGLMGESGPEAVLPLTRLANGDLGIQSLPGAGAGGFAGDRTVNISIDARGADRGAIADFRRTVNELARAINEDRANFRNNVLGTVMEARGRGGNIARAFGGW